MFVTSLNCFGGNELCLFSCLLNCLSFLFSTHHYYFLVIRNDQKEIMMMMRFHLGSHAVMFFRTQISQWSLTRRFLRLWWQWEVHELTSSHHFLSLSSFLLAWTQQQHNCSPRCHLLYWDNCPWVEAHQEEKLKLFPGTQGRWTVVYKKMMNFYISMGICIRQR